MYHNLYAQELSLSAQLDDLNKQGYRPSGQGLRDQPGKNQAGQPTLPAPLALTRRLASLLAGLLPSVARPFPASGHAGSPGRYPGRRLPDAGPKARRAVPEQI